MDSINHSAVNTILLIIVLQVLAYLAKSLKSLVDSMNVVKISVVEVKTVMLGTEGQGGLVRRVEGVARQGHDNANEITMLLSKADDLEQQLVRVHSKLDDLRKNS